MKVPKGLSFDRHSKKIIGLVDMGPFTQFPMAGEVLDCMPDNVCRADHSYRAAPSVFSERKQDQSQHFPEQKKFMVAIPMPPQSCEK